MVNTEVQYPHLHFPEGSSFPIITRVNFKGIHVVSNHLAHGWTPEELVINFPQLTLGEVYSTLAWYSDNRDNIDPIIAIQSVNAKSQALESRHRQIAKILKEKGDLKSNEAA